MQVDLRILRYDPERDSGPHWVSYSVQAEPMDRVLDLLHRVKYEVDGSLTFRRSCGHGVCGSDAMLINGRNRLACKIRVEQLGRRQQAFAAFAHAANLNPSYTPASEGMHRNAQGGGMPLPQG